MSDLLSYRIMLTELVKIIAKQVTNIIYSLGRGQRGQRGQSSEAAQPLGALYGLRPKALREPTVPLISASSQCGVSWWAPS